MSTFQSRQIITVDAVDSTNAFAAELLAQQTLPEGSVIIARHQTSGRGQFGAPWWSEPETSLTCSVVLTPAFLRPAELFFLNMAVSNAVCHTLGQLLKQDTFIKWPNDIVCGDAKLCGILIENTIAASEIRHVIVGIGINVNQARLPGFLSHATSMRQLTGLEYNPMQLVESLVGDLESEYDRLRTDRAGVQARYHERLLGLGRLRLFSRADETFNATITGVSAEGKLEVELEDGRRQAFAVKEVVFAA